MRGARLAVLFAALLATPAFADIQPFTTGSLDTITAQRAGRPFVLVLWSVDCAPCMRELRMLGDLGRQQPAFEYVLIATDEAGALADVRHTLKNFGLEQADNWIFADSFHERLRYQIDANWFGELPRAYLYDRDHNRTAVSGALKPEQLSEWAIGAGLHDRESRTPSVTPVAEPL